jgi:hypothetical protein
MGVTLEEYILARYFFYYPHLDDAAEYVDMISFYAETTATTESFGLSPGLNKVSFRVAADCFDKIALCLNIYFQLGHEESRLNFNKIWFEGLNPAREVLNGKLSQVMQFNSFLRALRDIQKDWFLKMFPPGDLKGIRNALTHSKFVLHSLDSENDDDAAEILITPKQDWSVNEFREVTIFLLRLIKSAITYLVCAIMLEEEEKLKYAEEKGHSYRILNVRPAWINKEPEEN